MASLIAGIDEAGRGCLAGPVAAAAVILNPARPIPGLADSKALSASKRMRLASQIRQNALAWGIGLVWQKRIDEANILLATFEAMAKAARALKIAPDKLLIDGNQTIPGKILSKCACDGQPLPAQECVIDGDQLEPAISAASIIAKTFRDSLMIAFARKWPVYHFEKHKGYGTKAHYAALREHGPCPLHRISFRGVSPSSQD